jgi:hypothetical protein
VGQKIRTGALGDLVLARLSRGEYLTPPPTELTLEVVQEGHGIGGQDPTLDLGFPELVHKKLCFFAMGVLSYCERGKNVQNLVKRNI